MDPITVEADQTAVHISVSVGGQDVAVRPSRKRRGRRTRRRSRGPDKRRKSWSKGITSREHKDLLRADGLASLIGRPLNTTLDFHPSHLDTYPTEDMDAFLQGLRTRLSTNLGRKKIGCHWVWTRENYEGERREHLHMVLHLPPWGRANLKADLEACIRRLYPGSPDLVRIGERTNVFNPQTRRWEDGLRYRMKQLRGDAVGAPGPMRLNRETRSRYDGAPVAPVYGKRCGISDSLSLKAEQKVRAARREYFASTETVRGGIEMSATQEGIRAPEPVN